MARPKSFNKEKVLESAMFVFWKKGYDATSMRDLEQATQLTPGSLYHEFGNKAGLFEHVLDFYVDAVMTWRVDRYLVDQEDAIDGVRQFLLSSVKDVPKKVRGDACLVTNTAAELGKADPKINRVLKRGFRVIEKGLTVQLERAQAQRQVSDKLDCKRAAGQLVHLMSGILVASKTQAPISALEETIEFTLATYQ